MSTEQAGFPIGQYCYDNQAKSEWLVHMKESHRSDRPLCVEEYNDALVLPDGGAFECFSGGVFDKTNAPIPISFQRNGIVTAEKLFNMSDTEKCAYIDKTVVYLGQCRNQWGSFLVDSIARLWFALDNPESYEYVFLGTQVELGGLHENMIEFLRLFGIYPQQIIYITEPTRFHKIIIPELSYVPLKEWHREYLAIFYRVVDRADCSGMESFDKVYFSRSKFSKVTRSDYGEELIAALMKANGFHIVYPEENKLQEQIYYVNHCSVFASVGGSCAHNIIFAKNRPKMILFNRMNGYQWHQWMLNEMAGVEPITYVDAYCEPYKGIFKTTIGGPYLYWINRNVKSFLHDQNMKVPKQCMSIGIKALIVLKYSIRVLHTIGARAKHKATGMIHEI